MRWLIWVPSAALVAIMASGVCAAFEEAYGDGSPYYGRTANMDKWSSPWPFAVVALVFTAAVIAVAAWAWRELGRRLTRS